MSHQFAFKMRYTARPTDAIGGGGRVSLYHGSNQ